MKKVEDFFSKYKKVSFKKGQVVIRSGEEIREIFYLAAGSIQMSVFSEDGKEVILHVFKTFSYFPMMLSLSKIENTYSFAAIEDSAAMVAPVSDVIEFVQREPEVLFDLTSRFSSALMGLSKRIEGMVFQDAYPRIVSLFVYLSEKFGEQRDQSIVVSLSLNHQDIASWTGVQRETASRQIEKMQQKGLIFSKDRYFVVPDIEALKREVRL